MEINIKSNDLAVPYKWANEEALEREETRVKSLSTKKPSPKTIRLRAAKNARKEIQDLRRWAASDGKRLCSELDNAIQPCHRPMRLLQYLRLFVEERVELLRRWHEESESTETDSYKELSNKYTHYMCCLSRFFHATQKTGSSSDIDTCLGFIYFLQARLKELDDHGAEFALSDSAIRLLIEALQRPHSLDLEIYSLIEEPCTLEQAEDCSRVRQYSMAYADAAQTVTHLVQHLNGTYDWFVCYAESLVKDFSKTAPCVTSPNIHGAPVKLGTELAYQGVEHIKNLRPVLQHLTQAVQVKDPNWEEVMELLMQVALASVKVVECFPDCSPVIKEIDATYTSLQQRLLKQAAPSKSAGAGKHKGHKKKTQRTAACSSTKTESSLELQTRLRHYGELLPILMDMLSIHQSYSTHIDTVRDNLHFLVTALVQAAKIHAVALPVIEAVEASPPEVVAEVTADQELVGSSSDIVIAAPVADALELWETPVDLVNLSFKCTELVDTFQRASYHVERKMTGLKQFLPLRAALYQAQMHLLNFIGSVQSVGVQRCPTDALETALSITEASYLAIEQTGKATTCALGHTPSSYHGLLRSYPKAIRDILGSSDDIDLRILYELNVATHWIRYPAESLQAMSRSSTLGSPRAIPQLLESIADCTSDPSARNVAALLTYSCRVAERTIRFLEATTPFLTSQLKMTAGSPIAMRMRDKLVPAPASTDTLLACRSRWKGVINVHGYLTKVFSETDKNLCKTRTLQQQRYLLGIQERLKTFESLMSVEQFSCVVSHLAEHLTLLYRSSFESIHLLQHGSLVDRPNTYELLQRIGASEALVEYFNVSIRKVNGVSRYPFEYSEYQTPWHELILDSALLAEYPELSEGWSFSAGTHTKGSLFRKFGIKESYSFDAIRDRAIALLAEAVEVYLAHVVPMLKVPAV